MPQYCLVKHRISTYVIDGDDADRNPDRVPVTGVVTFEALLDKGDSVVVTEDGVATTITLAAIEARITNGELWHRGGEGVKLFAGGPDTNPERIRYRAKFSNLIAGGKKIELKNILFEAVPGGTLELATEQPVPAKPYPGYTATMEDVLASREIAQVAAERAEAGAEISQIAAQSATEDATQTDRDRAIAVEARERAEAAAWKAELTTVGVNAVETPPGSGLWVIGSENLTISESASGSGLYTIGAT